MPSEREAVLALVKAVDLAQATDTALRSGARVGAPHAEVRQLHGYVPFTLTLGESPTLKSTAMYVRAVSRHDGMRASDEHSSLRDWLLHDRDVMPRQAETVYVGTRRDAGRRAGRIASSRQATAAAAAAFGALRCSRGASRSRRRPTRRRRRAETRELDPLLFPFEEYFFVDLKAARTAVERALALPPGEYDVYVGVHRSRADQDVEPGDPASGP